MLLSVANNCVFSYFRSMLFSAPTKNQTMDSATLFVAYFLAQPEGKDNIEYKMAAPI